MIELTEKEIYLLIRKRKGITLNQVAEALDLDSSTLSRYERNQYKLKPNKEAEYKAFIDQAKEKYQRGN